MRGLSGTRARPHGGALGLGRPGLRKAPVKEWAEGCRGDTWGEKCRPYGSPSRPLRVLPGGDIEAQSEVQGFVFRLETRNVPQVLGCLSQSLSQGWSPTLRVPRRPGGCRAGVHTAAHPGCAW